MQCIAVIDWRRSSLVCNSAFILDMLCDLKTIGAAPEEVNQVPKLVDHEQRRSEFEAAACIEISRVGIEGARMSDIAARVGVTTGSLIHYYPDKRTLLLAALEHSAKRMSKRMRRRLAQDPPDVLGFICEALPMSPQSRIDSIVWYHFWGTALHDRKVRLRQRRHHKQWIATITETLEGMQKEGRTAPHGTAQEIAEGISSYINGLMIRAILDPQDWPNARLKDHAKRMFHQLTE